MNKLSFTKVIMAIVMAICPVAFYAQSEGEVVENKTFNDYVYVSGDLGLGFLKGDNSGLKLGLNGHLGIGYQFDNILGIKGNIGFGGLNGKYENVTIDKLNYFEGNLNLIVNATDIILGYNPDRKFSVVPHVGIGQVRYKVKNDLNELGYNERDGREVAATIPMGIELNYIINPSWRVSLDFTATYADTDRLDGIARGEHNDWFSSVNLGASYKLNNSVKNVFFSNEACNYWYFMADGGASFVFGDNQYNFKSVRGNMNIGAGYNFQNNYRIYAKFGYGIYNGEYENLFTLDYADYYEANINVAADVVGLIFGYNEARRFGVYPHIGIGQMQYRARATFADGEKAYVGYDHNYNNQKGGGFADRKVALTIPMGIEFNYIVNQNVDAYLDVTTNSADSDVLDAFASGLHKDWHTTMNVGLRYKLNNKCFAVEETTEPVEDCCITPEELKQAIKEALEEQEANKPAKVETKTEVVEKHTIYHTNHANIVFPVNESEKLNSQTNIDALNRASNEVQNGFQVEDIIVEGYASPEGGADINDRLAEERAQAAADLVQEELHTHLDASHVKIHSNGADWDGLISAILGSNMNNKEEIANEIKNSSNREQTLNKLMGQYPEIKPLLPQLRRANVTITTVKDAE
ncbi:MAG: outer membrane beta-barrel protein [Bacteroidales bacterium]|nr:outer membrane beta-barrel protein [Bacteroidales bacterium]